MPKHNLHDMAVVPKSLDEHHAMLVEVVRLKLHFAHRWAAAHRDESLDHILTTRVDIWHKTHLNTGGLVQPQPEDCAAWRGILDRIIAIHAQCAGEDQRDDFESRAYAEVLADSVATRAPVDFENEQQGLHLRNYTCGSLRYHVMDEPGAVFMHIANAVSPRSIFDDPAYLPDCMRRLIDLAVREHQADCVHCCTWLNDVPKWLALFPQAWRDRLGPAEEDVRSHYGYWGQFINARGCFNAKLGQTMRQTGRFPYAMRRSWCTIDELRSHLDGQP